MNIDPVKVGDFTGDGVSEAGSKFGDIYVIENGIHAKFQEPDVLFSGTAVELQASPYASAQSVIDAAAKSETSKPASGPTTTPANGTLGEGKGLKGDVYGGYNKE